MKNQLKRPAFVALLALLLVASVALAEAMQTSYSRISATPTTTHSAVAAVDTSEITTEPVDGGDDNVYEHTKPTHGNPKATAYVLFNTSGATATLVGRLWLYKSDGTWVHLGQTAASLTAGTLPITSPTGDAGTGYMATAMPEWDTRGATHIEMVVTVLSAGTITVKPYCYGSATGRE